MTNIFIFVFLHYRAFYNDVCEQVLYDKIHMNSTITVIASRKLENCISMLIIGITMLSIGGYRNAFSPAYNFFQFLKLFPGEYPPGYQPPSDNPVFGTIASFYG